MRKFKGAPNQILSLSKTSPDFTCLQNNSFENTVGNGEIARDEQFLFFPWCFLSFSSNLKSSSANSLSLEESKICRLEKI